MDLAVKEKHCIVGGATYGFGEAVSSHLIALGAYVLPVARGEEKLRELQAAAPNQVKWVAGDITNLAVQEKPSAQLNNRPLRGLVSNTGGPPAKTVMETTAGNLDPVYRTLLGWKVLLIKKFIPDLVKNKYGSVLLIESATVKQPLKNLVLNISLLAALVGLVKTLSQEIACSGETFNVLGPHSHNTPAIDRFYRKKYEQSGLPFEELKAMAIWQIPVGFLRDAADFARLALWIPSPFRRFITSQAISFYGGAVKGIMG